MSKIVSLQHVIKHYWDILLFFFLWACESWYGVHTVYPHPDWPVSKCSVGTCGWWLPCWPGQARGSCFPGCNNFLDSSMTLTGKRTLNCLPKRYLWNAYHVLGPSFPKCGSRNPCKLQWTQGGFRECSTFLREAWSLGQTIVLSHAIHLCKAGFSAAAVIKCSSSIGKSMWNRKGGWQWIGLGNQS